MIKLKMAESYLSDSIVNFHTVVRTEPFYAGEISGVRRTGKWRDILLFVALYFHFSLLPAQQIIVLGTAQDAGYPHIACKKQCCKDALENNRHENVVSFALVDSVAKKWWLFEATPDITAQLNLFRKLSDSVYDYMPAGIFITHAHIGHYTGLMYLGREAMNAQNIPVYCLPKMAKYLTKNGPWSQLVKIKNIELKIIKPNDTCKLNSRISVLPFLVPHRDEYSETAGFKINATGKNILFIPDIDKWEKWNKNIVEEVKNCDIALLDATFSDSTELPGKRMSSVPHPFVKETIALFQNENNSVKSRIYFIHFNHTNPMIDNKNIFALPPFPFNRAITGLKL